MRCSKALDPQLVVCPNLIAAANGGSLLLSSVEDLPLSVQMRLTGLFAGLGACGEAAAVRLIAGTTVSLRQRMRTGTFLEPLFYRLNVIHLVANNREGHRIQL